MAQTTKHILVPFLLVMLMAIAEAKTPTGIAKNPSNASCNIKKYKHCYNLVHVCPKFCPNSCTVECASCKPICVGGSNPPTTTPSTTPTYPPSTPSPKPPTPSTKPPSPKPPTPSPKPPSPTPSTPSPKPPTPSPSTPSSTPPSPTPIPPLTSTPPSTPYPNPPRRTPSTPPSTTPGSPYPSPSSSPTNSGAGQKRARCQNKNYPQCYNMEHVCPTSCPGGCEVDCVTCKPVCKCNKPGAVCQDPRFIGGDGITFYFHGKKNHDFCLLSDPNLHINDGIRRNYIILLRLFGSCNLVAVIELQLLKEKLQLMTSNDRCSLN